jgi:hypothetical protein
VPPPAPPHGTAAAAASDTVVPARRKQALVRSPIAPYAMTKSRITPMAITSRRGHDGMNTSLPRTLTVLAVGALCVTTSGAHAQSSRAAIIARLDSIAQAPVNSGAVAGIAVAVVQGHDTLLMKGYGYADLENQLAVTPQTVFRIGSLTKQFTSSAVMQLVELIRGIATDAPTYQSLLRVVEKLGKTAASAEDFPAFIVNRILLPMINEAIYTLYEGVGSVEAIDTAMRLGANHPMGPLQLADFIGLDTCLSIMQALHEGLADSKYRPCPLLVKYVEAGWLGKKTGRGFYTYAVAAK